MADPFPFCPFFLLRRNSLAYPSHLHLRLHNPGLLIEKTNLFNPQESKILPGPHKVIEDQIYLHCQIYLRENETSLQIGDTKCDAYLLHQILPRHQSLPLVRVFLLLSPSHHIDHRDQKFVPPLSSFSTLCIKRYLSQNTTT